MSEYTLEREWVADGAHQHFTTWLSTEVDKLRAENARLSAEVEILKNNIAVLEKKIIEFDDPLSVEKAEYANRLKDESDALNQYMTDTVEDDLKNL